MKAEKFEVSEMRGADGDEVVLKIMLTDQQEKYVNAYLDILRSYFPERKYSVCDVLMSFVIDGIDGLHRFVGD